MRRDLICVAKNEKVYVFNANTPFKLIDNVKSVNDIVSALISQKVQYTAVEISDSVKLFNGTLLYNIDGHFGKTYERNLYFYNLNDHRVVFSFLNKTVSNNGMRELNSKLEDGSRFEVSCLKNEVKHYQLTVVCCKDDIIKSFCYDEVFN